MGSRGGDLVGHATTGAHHRTGSRAERSGGAVRLVNAIVQDIAIISDPALRQVIGNVIDNALEVSPGFVALSASLVNGHAVLEVTDRGPGFAPVMLEAFGRPYSSSKGRSGGGLGLFLVVNVVRKLGGRVEVNNPPAGGALVRVSIPVEALAHTGARR